MRRLQSNMARAALSRAEGAARQAAIPALSSEVEHAVLAMNTPVARLIAQGQERPLLLDEVEALLASTSLVVDACRYSVRGAGMPWCRGMKPTSCYWGGPLKKNSLRCLPSSLTGNRGRAPPWRWPLAPVSARCNGHFTHCRPTPRCNHSDADWRGVG